MLSLSTTLLNALGVEGVTSSNVEYVIDQGKVVQSRVKITQD